MKKQRLQQLIDKASNNQSQIEDVVEITSEMYYSMRDKYDRIEAKYTEQQQQLLHIQNMLASITSTLSTLNHHLHSPMYQLIIDDEKNIDEFKEYLQYVKKESSSKDALEVADKTLDFLNLS